jgi:hypothetical protein
MRWPQVVAREGRLLRFGGRLPLAWVGSTCGGTKIMACAASKAVVDPHLDLCVRGCAVRSIVAFGSPRGARAALNTRPLQRAAVEEHRLTAEHVELVAPLRLRLLSADVLLPVLLLVALLPLRLPLACSKNLSKHECGLKRRRAESRLFNLGSPGCRENPKTIGSVNPQFHLLHSSASPVVAAVS